MGTRGYADKACFLPFKKLLDHKRFSGLAKLMLHQNLIDRFERLIIGSSNDHPFARGESVCLKNHGQRMVLNVGACGFGFCKRTPLRGWNAVSVKKAFRETLRAFKLRRGLRGPEAGKIGTIEPIHNTRDQRSLRPDDRQIDLVITRHRYQSVNIGSGDRNVFDLFLPRRPGVTGRNENLCHRVCLSNLPGQSVLAPAVTDD